MELGRLGVRTWLDALPATEVVTFARKVETWGYSVLWAVEGFGRDPFVILSLVAANTSRLRLATGIANIYARDPMAMRAAQLTLGEISGGRFILGLGVSHGPIVKGLRGHEYGPPIATMRAYLDAMERSTFSAPLPAETPPVVLAALRPRMLALAAERTRGAHPYAVTPGHTARARKILGPTAWLCPDQMAVLETDATRARAVARQHLAMYLGLPNYLENLRTLGFGDADFQDGGSDRLIDSIMVWGDERAIAARIREHHDAGADHVCLQAFRPDGALGPDLRLLEALAPARR
jgi:probable F420-dependent oxidoreductase